MLQNRLQLTLQILWDGLTAFLYKGKRKIKPTCLSVRGGQGWAAVLLMISAASRDGDTQSVPSWMLEVLVMKGARKRWPVLLLALGFVVSFPEQTESFLSFLPCPPPGTPFYPSQPVYQSAPIIVPTQQQQPPPAKREKKTVSDHHWPLHPLREPPCF